MGNPKKTYLTRYQAANSIYATEEGLRCRPRPVRRKQRRLPARALRRKRSPKAKGAKDPRAEGQMGPSVK